MRRFLTAIILGVAIFVVAVLFGQFLGGFYIYNLVVEDNPTVAIDKEIPGIERVSPPAKKVLRLEPIEFYTIQVGIFEDTKSTQDTVQKLAQLGLKPFVTSQSPYKIWIGCFSERDGGQELEGALKRQGFEAFIGKGLVNDRALKFPGDDQFMINSFAPLLGKFDLVLNHSLKMFRSPKFSGYKRETWEYMIDQLQKEVAEGIRGIDDLIELPESKIYQTELAKLKEKAQAYDAGLGNIITLNNDTGVIYAQGQLLELIAAYHNIINQVNAKLNYA